MNYYYFMSMLFINAAMTLRMARAFSTVQQPARMSIVLATSGVVLTLRETRWVTLLARAILTTCTRTIR